MGKDNFFIHPIGPLSQLYQDEGLYCRGEDCREEVKIPKEFLFSSQVIPGESWCRNIYIPFEIRKNRETNIFIHF
jgi:hypothetical protein